MSMLAQAFALSLQVAASAPPLDAVPFTIPSADGHLIQGETNRPAGPSRGVVILVAGTGVFTRDVSFGRSGTPGDFIFRDLATRLTRRGMTVVRFDRRGARYGVPREERTDRLVAPTATAENLSQDVEALYDWTRSTRGLGAQCVVLFGHSEGTVHIAGLAERGAPPPALVIGMGGLMESKAAVVRWQSVDRDADSLLMMDGDGDGVVTDEEVRANFGNTPAGVYEDPAPFLNPAGRWTAGDIAALRAEQAALFAQEGVDLANHADDAPYPDAERPIASWRWWKSWFLDDTPIAVRFSHWSTPLILHYGDRDSQVREERQRAAVQGVLPDGQVRFVSHPGRGHALGPDVLLGPIDDAIAEQIADEAAAACPEA
ncbi:MAG: alpha/beta hydrolase [Brevundimonas sp.]